MQSEATHRIAPNGPESVPGTVDIRAYKLPSISLPMARLRISRTSGSSWDHPGIPELAAVSGAFARCMRDVADGF